jgi:selenide, water dikinase
MRRQARARDAAAALASMRRSNAVAARLLRDHGAAAVTDVTGFGLAGHLSEMLDASGYRATIGLAQCRRYTGVDQLIAAGVRSSLLADNLALRDKIELHVEDEEAALALLLDPQTSGGLLAGLSPEVVPPLLEAMADGGVEAFAIGAVEREGGQTGSDVRIKVRSSVELLPTAGAARYGASLEPLTAQ